jgi:predicted RNA binding protein YcfA (HicA-like mRNA interferase family)
MSERFPRLSGKEVVRALLRLGFSEDRIKGSHVILIDSSAKLRVTVPVHAGKTLPVGTLRAILDDAEVSIEDLRTVL